VGKTAVVEGFALRIAQGDVPEPLRQVQLRTLDLGLLQAGAGVKGEFENRLKQVIEEVQSSSRPIILFIDEAHTLIGAGGAEGQNDAANLLKPALARGELRTIAATTWAEYKKYFEKDPALTRRFQVIKVEEPAESSAIAMMRGLAPKLELHHKVRVLDEAVVESVRLSHRYIPARQLPDKSVSVLDTACARVAATTPQVLDVSEAVRRKGRLTVVPMRGWRRSMRWSETGLTFVQTSHLVPDFAAVVGFAMVGLCCEGNRFSHGLGAAYPYRGIAYPGKTADQLQKDLTALRLPGIRFSKVAVNNRKGQPTTGVFVEVTDWADWNPTELSFHMMRLACRYDPPNPFAKLTDAQMRSFNIHVGSQAWGIALRAQGARVDVEGWVRRWREQARVYQAETKKYWLYQ
jgi:hypothetical protein